MCLGVDKSVPPCHSPAKWSPPPACEYIYNPVIHTPGGVVGLILLSGIGFTAIFLVSLKLVKRFLPKCSKLRKTKLFMAAGYTMANFARRTFSTIEDFFADDSDEEPRQSGHTPSNGNSYATSSCMCHLCNKEENFDRTTYLDETYQSNVWYKNNYPIIWILIYVKNLLLRGDFIVGHGNCESWKLIDFKNVSIFHCESSLYALSSK